MDRYDAKAVSGYWAKEAAMLDKKIRRARASGDAQRLLWGFQFLQQQAVAARRKSRLWAESGA